MGFSEVHILSPERAARGCWRLCCDHDHTEEAMEVCVCDHFLLSSIKSFIFSPLLLVALLQAPHLALPSYPVASTDSKLQFYRVMPKASTGYDIWSTATRDSAISFIFFLFLLFSPFFLHSLTVEHLLGLYLCAT